MDELILQAKDLIAVFGVRVVAAIATFVIGRWVAAILKRIIVGLMNKSKVEPTLVSFVGNVSHAALLVFVALAALGQLGIQTASFVAIIGAAGLAVGLALQGSLANFAAGVLMIIFKPFKVGDFVDAGGTMGTVEDIQIFTTQMKTPDNKTIIIPNASITSGAITNFSSKPTRRVDMTFGVSYTDDTDKVKRVIQEVLDADERILKDPTPTIGLVELADSSVNFAVRPWVNAGDYWGVFFDINEKMKKRFDAEGISIPFPQRDVHMYQELIEKM